MKWGFIQLLMKNLAKTSTVHFKGFKGSSNNQVKELDLSDSEDENDDLNDILNEVAPTSLVFTLSSNGEVLASTATNTSEAPSIASDTLPIKLPSEGHHGGTPNAGNDNAGNDNAGNDTSGNDNSGNDKAGNDNAGNDNAGNDNAGNDNAGNGNAGNDIVGDIESSSSFTPLTSNSMVLETRIPALKRKSLGTINTREIAKRFRENNKSNGFSGFERCKTKRGNYMMTSKKKKGKENEY